MLLIKKISFLSIFLVGLVSATSVNSVPFKTSDAPFLIEELNTDGLYFAEFYDYIYRGHFEHVELAREDQLFLMIYSKYLRTFGATCPDQLPENKVEIMDLICVTEEVTTQNGMETSRVCVEYERVGSGIFADPELYAAQLRLEKEQASDFFPKTLEMLSDPNSIGNSLDMVHKSKGLLGDMERFFILNPCESEALKQFERNLMNYALNQESDRLEGVSKYQQMKESGGPTGAQDFTKLLDNLVKDQARTWVFNKYQAGSISDVAIQSKDQSGRPKIIQANYKFSGFMGNSQGWVRVLFENGLPECIIFYDYPENCKTPNSGIVSDYAEGGYRK
ncbi:hypothetical protein [Algoriphagus machipongonensis]|uniref:Uncharacterized protein n=1 Tax=Algoriphagus machipongonensis TaxID=388413 RepID=A3HZ56_9BACT|nr:hypothetical protein [Algoriphagus machipongonensis]EAZ80542.1 hypothetical protein ALPR1_06450 [Algoriphagus machipongonensis]